MKFADPKNDLAFKKIFGNEKKKEILISFLNAVLDFKGEKRIVDVKIVNPYQVPKIEDLKETILDIKAKNEKGEEFIVEMQKRNLGDFAKRSLYYTSKAYVSQLDKKQDYSKLKKVYFIGILNFNIFEGDNYITRHLILNQETLKQELKDFEFTFIELPKFNKKLNELETILDKWIYFIKYAQDLTMIPKEFESIEEFKEAFEEAMQYKWDKKEVEIYEYIGLKEYDEIHALETAKKEGIKEAQTKIAKNLLKKGFNIDEISEITNLSKEEINKIKGE